MNKKIKEFLIMFVVMLIDYCIISINIRTLSDGNYIWSMISDIAISSINFFVIKRIADSNETLHQWIGYTIGASIGSIIGIYLSKFIIGH